MQVMQTETLSYPKNAARFVEVIRARAPRGFSEAVKRAASANQLSTSEFVRRALAGAIEQSTTERGPESGDRKGFGDEDGVMFGLLRNEQRLIKVAKT